MLGYLASTNLTDNQKYHLYSKSYSSDETIKLLKQFKINANNYFNTIKYISDVKKNYTGDKNKNYRRQLI